MQDNTSAPVNQCTHGGYIYSADENDNVFRRPEGDPTATPKRLLEHEIPDAVWQQLLR